MNRYIIIHYGEIYLKGGNRKFFEDKLIENIKLALAELGGVRVKHIAGRIIIPISQEWDLDLVKEKLLKVFGIENFSFAWNSKQDYENIEKNLYSLIKAKKFKTFRISTRRNNKAFVLKSNELDKKLGAMVLEKMSAGGGSASGGKKKVDLENFDLNCHLDIVREFAFIYFEKNKCRGGLPVGVSEPLICLLSGGIDSPVAANMMQKRGAPIIYVNFDSYPSTPKENQEKVKDLVKVLNQYQTESKLYIVPFLDIQKEILKKVPDDYRVIFYRRMMYRIAEKIAQKENVLGLVTGESLGQVASQTVENIRAVDEVVNLPVMRPLIGMNKDEITVIAREIKTYEISALPFNDCCSLYVPKHPVTRADLNLVLDTEKGWDYKKLLKKAIDDSEIIQITIQ
jgi:tRNA uracil 4-sulfurtransferase